MEIRLDRERFEPVVWAESVDLELDHDVICDLGRVACRGRADASDAGFLVRADLAWDQTLYCTRCLKPSPAHLESRLELRVVCHEEHEPGQRGEVELEEGDMTVLHISGDCLDTEPLVAEQVLLELPMKPLCREDCRGICPQCGADRNEKPDCCESTNADPRWDGLEAIRSRFTDAE